MKLTVKTRQQLATEYGTSVRTFIRKLRENGLELPHGNIFPKTIREVYYKLGIPAGLKSDFDEVKSNEINE
jgi:hypothetical protein